MIDSTSQPAPAAPFKEQPSPANVRLEGRARLGAFLDGIESFVGEEYLQLIDSVEKDLVAPLSAGFSEAASRHKQAAETLRAHQPDIPSEAWKVLLDYRRTVVENVFPVLETVFQKSPVFKLNQQYQRFSNRLIEHAATVPETEQVLEDQDLYEAKKSDGLARRTLKQAVRLRRKVRKSRRSVQNGLRKLLRRPMLPPIQYRQPVPLKALLTYHVKVRIPQYLIPIFKSTHRALTQPLAAYEKAVTTWTYQILQAEHQLALPIFDFTELDEWLIDKDIENAKSKTVSAESWQHLLDTSDTLQNALDEIATLPFSAEEPVTNWLAQAHLAFRDDLHEGGTRLLRGKERALPPAASLPSAHIQTYTSSWNTWYSEMQNRMALNHLLCSQRDLMLDGYQSMLRSISRSTLLPILQSFKSLRDTFNQISQDATQICKQSANTTDTASIETALSPLRQRINQQFKFIMSDLSSLLRAGQELDQPGGAFWQDLRERSTSMPNALTVHKPDEKLPLPLPKRNYSYEIDLQQIAASTLNEDLSTQLRPSAHTLQKAVIHMWEETQQVEFMVDYNLNAAFEELHHTDEATPPDSPSEGTDIPADAEQDATSDTPSQVDSALELITSGLSRSNEKLTELVADLHKPWAAFATFSFNTIQQYTQKIYQDVLAEDNLQSSWTNFTIQASRFAVRSRQQFLEQKDATLTSLNALIRRGQRQTRQLIKKGQSAVGVVGQSEEQWLHTLQLASDVDALHKRLPLVYRRLFSLKPITEPDLLEGRKLDLAFVKKHFERWQANQTSSLILAMPSGSGRTSFMNVLARSVFQEANTKYVALDRRIADTAALAEWMASVLGFPSGTTLENMEAHLMTKPRETPTRVVLIDHLEHLLLCIPGGDDLIERALLFLSRTDGAIYWIANISTHAWHFLEKTIKPSSGFITAYQVTRMHRQSLEDIIAKRHRRSGMNLHFKPAQGKGSFFNFGRPKGEKEQQDAFRQAFFERLFRLTGQNILLALLYWLRSVEFDSEKDALLVKNLEPINFSFLDTLDLTRAFTLKSFLLHGTLTLEEHRRIFRLSETESTFIMESLLNLRIIEPTLAEPLTTPYSRIVANHPYQLHPLILHPVTEFLKRLHIVY